MATLTFSPIQLTNWDRDNIQKLNTWLFQLMENLRYVLDNIGEENVSTELMKEIEIINTYKQELDKLEEKMEKVDLQYKEEIAQLNGEASTSKAGLMSASDKSKLDGIDKTWKNIYSSTPKTAFSISSITSGDYTEIIVRVEYYDSNNLYREALIAIPIWEITRDGGNVYRYYYIGHQTATVSIGINKNKIFLAWLNAGGVTYTEESSTNMYVYYR